MSNKQRPILIFGNKIDKNKYPIPSVQEFENEFELNHGQLIGITGALLCILVVCHFVLKL